MLARAHGRLRQATVARRIVRPRARAAVLDRIATAAARAGRDPAEVTLVAVSKTVAAPRVQSAIDAGLDVLGENRVQEAADKIPATSGGAWHLVGPLQSNKAGRAVDLFAAIQSVDGLALAQRLDRLAGERRPGRPLPVLLQVNVADDPSKAGFSPAGVAADLASILALPNLRVDGLMTIGPLVHRPTTRGRRSSRCGGCRRSSASATRRSAPRCRWA